MSILTGRDPVIPATAFRWWKDGEETRGVVKLTDTGLHRFPYRVLIQGRSSSTFRFVKKWMKDEKVVGMEYSDVYGRSVRINVG